MCESPVDELAGVNVRPERALLRPPSGGRLQQRRSPTLTQHWLVGDAPSVFLPTVLSRGSAGPIGSQELAAQQLSSFHSSLESQYPHSSLQMKFILIRSHQKETIFSLLDAFIRTKASADTQAAAGKPLIPSAFTYLWGLHRNKRATLAMDKKG